MTIELIEPCKKIARLHGELDGDTEFVRHIIELYRGEADAFARAVADGLSHDQLQILAHKLAGSSAQIAPDNVLDEIRTVEQLAAQGASSTHELDVVLSTLPPLVGALEQWVETCDAG